MDLITKCRKAILCQNTLLPWQQGVSFDGFLTGSLGEKQFFFESVETGGDTLQELTAPVGCASAGSGELGTVTQTIGSCDQLSRVVQQDALDAIACLSRCQYGKHAVPEVPVGITTGEFLCELARLSIGDTFLIAPDNPIDLRSNAQSL